MVKTLADVYELALRYIAELPKDQHWQVPHAIARAFKVYYPDRQPEYDVIGKVVEGLEPQWDGYGTFDIDSVTYLAWSLWEDVRGESAVETAAKRAIAEPAAVDGPRLLRLIVAYARDAARVYPEFTIPQAQLAGYFGLNGHAAISRAIHDAVTRGYIEVVDDSWSYATKKGKLYRLGPDSD